MEAIGVNLKILYENNVFIEKRVKRRFFLINEIVIFVLKKTKNAWRYGGGVVKL